jgi:hypothetical protein
MEASPACRSLYCKVLAREYADRVLLKRAHRLAVDAYAVQHPGRASAQSIQSVAVHLMSLCAVLVEGADAAWATKLIREGVRNKDQFSWLVPPDSMGALTIVDVWRETDAVRHEARVAQWASAAWRAWSAHHATITGGTCLSAFHRNRRTRDPNFVS